MNTYRMNDELRTALAQALMTEADNTGMDIDEHLGALTDMTNGSVIADVSGPYTQHGEVTVYEDDTTVYAAMDYFGLTHLATRD